MPPDPAKPPRRVAVIVPGGDRRCVICNVMRPRIEVLFGNGDRPTCADRLRCDRAVREQRDALREALREEINWLYRQATDEDQFTPPANASAAYRVAAQHLRRILDGKRPGGLATAPAVSRMRRDPDRGLSLMPDPKEQERCGGSGLIETGEPFTHGSRISKRPCSGCPDCTFGADRNELVPDLHIGCAEVAPDHGSEPCGVCDGSGQVGDDVAVQPGPCPACGGSGIARRSDHGSEVGGRDTETAFQEVLAICVACGGRVEWDQVETHEHHKGPGHRAQPMEFVEALPYLNTITDLQAQLDSAIKQRDEVIATHRSAHDPVFIAWVARAESAEQALSALRIERDAAVTRAEEAEKRPWTDCPSSDYCKSCPCAAEDDVCFPGERLRVELAAASSLLAQRDTELERVIGGLEKRAIEQAAKVKGGELTFHHGEVAEALRGAASLLRSLSRTQEGE